MLNDRRRIGNMIVTAAILRRAWPLKTTVVAFEIDSSRAFNCWKFDYLDHSGAARIVLITNGSLGRR
jgi:hypothetical protein